MKSCLALTGVLLATVPLARSAEPDAGSWPQFRGPNACGVAALGSYPAEFGPKKRLLWKTAIPSGVSSPSIWADRIFLTSYTPEEKKLETICLRRTDGNILWRRTAPAEEIERVHEISSPANATPATDGERVYAFFASYGLICYDMEGKELWHHQTPVVQSRFGNGTSPILSGTTVFLSRPARRRARQPSEQDSPVVALDGRTGEVIWKATTGGGARYASPVLWRHEHGEQLVVLSPTRLTGYDATNGKEVWWLDGLPPQSCATPVLADGNIYVSVTGAFGEPDNFLGFPLFEVALKDYDKNGDGSLQVEEVPEDLVIVDRRASGNAGNSAISLFLRGFDRNRDKIISEQEWKQFTQRVSGFVTREPALISVRLGGEGDIRETNVNWQHDRGVAEVPSPLVYNGHLYTVRNGGIVHCRNPKTGEEVFRGRLGAVGGYFASPIGADGKVYFASDRGAVVVISAGDSLKVLARNELNEPIMATPALVDGTIYVRTENHLHAFAN